MMQMVHSRFNALLSACVLSLIATTGWSQSITWLGTLGGSESEAYGVSADGRVVVGRARNAAGQWRAFRWTAEGGMRDLGTLGGSESWAYGVSADGSVVVGWAQNAAGHRRAFRWTALSGRMVDLGTLGGNQSEAYGVSADGAVVVGWASYNNYYGYGRAFRWTESGGMQDLDTRGGVWSYAYGVSADGSVVVGAASSYYYFSYIERSFRWTASGGMQDLSTWQSGASSSAQGVSADGSVVVGLVRYNYTRAFRCQNGVVQILDTPYPSEGEAYGVSADGSVVVGWASTDIYRNPAYALRWTAARGWGWEDLNMTYTLWTYPSELRAARAISPDGRYIVGWGRNAATNRIEAFLLDTRLMRCAPDAGDVNCDGIVDDADLLEVLFNFGNRYR
jgi:probable HAF family extracellular repeat protein